ncbi:MAG: methyltransferase domain-containing protein [Aliarcobacter sp.]|nr:methyltransferase domain-containing protein [Aliarcobacter sp.]
MQGNGNTSIYAKKIYSQKIYAVELCEVSNFDLKRNEFEEFIIGNIEDINLPYEEYFDVIICADVLEHLINPDLVINKLKKYLKKGGIIISSIPNIREYTVLKTIFIDGNFKYESAGILDQTHVRFFCKKNVEDLYIKNEMIVIKNLSNINFDCPRRAFFNKITLGIFEEFFNCAVLYCCKKIIKINGKNIYESFKTIF